MIQPLFEHRQVLAGYDTRVLELEGAGAPIVMFHGYADSADTRRQSLDLLARRGRRAIAVDLPGFRTAQRLGGGPILPQLDDFALAAIRSAPAPARSRKLARRRRRAAAGRAPARAARRGRRRCPGRARDEPPAADRAARPAAALPAGAAGARAQHRAARGRGAALSTARLRQPGRRRPADHRHLHEAPRPPLARGAPSRHRPPPTACCPSSGTRSSSSGSPPRSCSCGVIATASSCIAARSTCSTRCPGRGSSCCPESATAPGRGARRVIGLRPRILRPVLGAAW